MIKSDWIRVKVVLSYKSRLIAVCLHILGQGGLALVKAGEFIDSIYVGVFAGPQHGSAWCANGVGNKGVCKTHTLASQTIEVRGWGNLSQSSTVGTDGVRGVIVGHDPEDVGRCCL